jgi:uncharacterized membrane protein YdbT with pleckstrin-like domain
MTYSSIIVAAVKWLTRIGGAIFVVLGVAAIGEGVWHGGLLGQLLIGTFAIAFGSVCLSIRDTGVGGLEYGIFRRKR